MAIPSLPALSQVRRLTMEGLTGEVLTFGAELREAALIAGLPTG
jgi:hypothetical protein